MATKSYVSLPHSCVFWDLAEWGFFGSCATDSGCPWQVGIGYYGFRNSDIPGDWSSTMPWNQCAAVNPFVAAISGQAPWFFLWGDLRLQEGAVNDVVDGIMSWYPARTSTARQPMAASSVNFETTGQSCSSLVSIMTVNPPSRETFRTLSSREMGHFWPRQFLLVILKGTVEIFGKNQDEYTLLPMIIHN